MPLLLYCVAPESAADTTIGGVDGASVRSVTRAGLRFYLSEVTTDMASIDVAKAARAVHEVVNDVFRAVPVLPFRYPTVIAGEDELTQMASERGAAFREFLQRVRDHVQMDIRLTLTSDTPPEADSTGRAYLEARARSQAQLFAAAETCRQTANPADWRIQQRAENIRCQALISRVEVLSFLKRMRMLELPGGVKAAISGPWPPAGFWEDGSR